MSRETVKLLWNLDLNLSVLWSCFRIVSSKVMEGKPFRIFFFHLEVAEDEEIREESGDDRRAEKGARCSSKAERWLCVRKERNGQAQPVDDELQETRGREESSLACRRRGLGVQEEVGIVLSWPVCLRYAPCLSTAESGSPGLHLQSTFQNSLLLLSR